MLDKNHDTNEHKMLDKNHDTNEHKAPVGCRSTLQVMYTKYLL